MKFRYFLRGLGVGIIFASILLLLVYRENMSNNRLSDAEIIEKAKALGMVEADSRIGSLLSEQNTSSDKSKDGEKTTDTSQNSEDQNLKTEEATKETDMQQEDSLGQSNSGDTAQQDMIEITIERGASSYPVCQQLQELGMITDAAEFDTYMVQNGYADRIRVGTHKLIKGMSFKDIAEAISDPA